MARKIAQHSTDKKGLSKVDSTWNFMQDDALRFFPGKDAWRDRLKYSFFEWVRSEDKKGRKPVEIMQFCREYGIPYNTLINWVNQYPDIKAVYNEVKLILASYRREGAIFKEMDKEAVYRDLHRLDPEWHEINMYHAALKDKERSDNEQKIVIIERFPETDIVPIKKNNNVE